MKRLPTFVHTVFAAAILVLFAVGCSNKLETGYQPRTIGSDETERRGYYAAPFSREAREARQSADDDMDARRPSPGY